jgi:hypothetical protein
MSVFQSLAINLAKITSKQKAFSLAHPDFIRPWQPKGKLSKIILLLSNFPLDHRFKSPPVTKQLLFDRKHAKTVK